MLLIPAAAALVFALLFFFSDQPRLRSKIVVGVLLLMGLSLQFAGAYVGLWVLGILINVALAVFCLLYFQAGAV